jgi:poly(3-hydroxybutyrate) depolymerase
MRLGSRLLLAPLLSFSSLLVGCGDDGAGTGGGGGSSSTSSTSSGTPEDLVPPEPLGGDPATACPGSYATTAPAAGQNTGFESAGQNRSFVLLEPPASFEGPRPMLFAFNGTGETGQGFADRAGLEEFAAAGFVVVAPSSAGNGELWPVWDSMHQPGEDTPAQNPDLVLFDQLVACVAAHRPIDKHRLYVAGHSAGGIMSNYVLQRRSELLAGGIVASGVHSLTSPSPKAPLDDMFVIVTWGGDNDEYSGGSGGVSVPKINFVEQAAIASAAYDAEAAVSQAYCRGDDLGHAWLSPINGWLAAELLAHPKGLAQKGTTTLAPVPEGGRATCSTEVYAYEGGLTVICPTTSAVEGCADVCQFMADCGVENSTVGPALGPQLADLGFAGEDNTQCGGCVTHCEGAATGGGVDAEVLDCMVTAQEAATCGPGIDGALPLIDAINTCCDGRTDSPWCMDVCAIMFENSVTHGFIPTCVELAQ